MPSVQFAAKKLTAALLNLPTMLALSIVLLTSGCGGSASSSGGGTPTPPPSTAKEWTWMSGSSSTNAPGVYGTLGTASASNVPGARDSAVSWTDNSGNLWLFGGTELNGTVVEFLNDLWEFNPTAKTWTWISGSNTINAEGVYGTLGTASASNAPGARSSSVSWVDSSGNLWLFGGVGFGEQLGGNSEYGDLNDLWEFSPTAKTWTWVSGGTTADATGVYGSLGAAASSNVPGGRDSAVSWIDGSGNLWLFGGAGHASPGTGGVLNDLWKFNPTAKTWTWVSGSSTVNAGGVYGTLGTAATGNVPGSRYPAVSWTDSSGNFWLFGGSGYAAGTSGALNDLWEFNPTAKTWTWVSGSSTVDAKGVYGTLGTASASKEPGARASSVSWVDSRGNLWLLGGGNSSTQGTVDFNDLWRYQP